MNNHRNLSASSYPGLPAISVLPPPQCRWQENADPSSQSRASSEARRRIERSIHYMREHLSQPLQVATLAETAHTSPSHFFVLFKRWVGLSPIDYFIRLRMTQACQLLTSTSMSVKEVAAVLGYDDPFYFSRVFKSVNGAPPTAYRTKVEAMEQSSSCRLERPAPVAAVAAVYDRRPTQETPASRLAALPSVNGASNGRHSHQNGNGVAVSQAKVLTL